MVLSVLFLVSSCQTVHGLKKRQVVASVVYSYCLITTLGQEVGAKKARLFTSLLTACLLDPV